MLVVGGANGENAVIGCSSSESDTESSAGSSGIVSSMKQRHALSSFIYLAKRISEVDGFPTWCPPSGNSVAEDRLGRAEVLAKSYNFGARNQRARYPIQN